MSVHTAYWSPTWRQGRGVPGCWLFYKKQWYIINHWASSMTTSHSVVGHFHTCWNYLGYIMDYIMVQLATVSTDSSTLISVELCVRPILYDRKIGSTPGLGRGQPPLWSRKKGDLHIGYASKTAHNRIRKRAPLATSTSSHLESSKMTTNRITFRFSLQRKQSPETSHR